MAVRETIPPIAWDAPLVDPKTGHATLQFQRLLQALAGNEELTDQEVEDFGEGLEAKADKATQIIAGTGMNGGGNLSEDRTLDADIQAMLDGISSTWGAVLFRGENDWQALGPGTAGHFLKTNGADADPEWAAGGGGGGGGGGISVEATGTFTVVNGGTTETKTLPGTPAEDDYVLIVQCSDGTNGMGIATSGYTNVAYQDGAGLIYQIAYKKMGASPDTEVEINSVDVRDVGGCILLIRGIATVAPLDGALQSATGSSGMPNPPSYTTNNASAIRIIVGFLDDDAIVPTVPAGFTAVVSEIATPDNSSTCMIAWLIESSTGTVDPDAFGGSGTDDWYAAHFALKGA